MLRTVSKFYPTFYRGLSISVATAAEELKLERLTGDCNGVVVLSMNRPKAMNAISRSMLKSFYESLETVKYDAGVRVVVIRSAVVGAFCAGADLKERATMRPEEVPAFVSRARNLMTELEELPQPVIAAIDGVALGGGMEMALACDLRVAASTAKLGLTETKLAIIPGAGGTQRLTRLIGVAKTKELIYTARIVDGDTAYRLGLVNQVVPQSDDGNSAYLRALLLAKEILPNGPVAVRSAKTAIGKGAEVDLQTALAIEKLCYAQVIPTQDRLEALKAFREKRPPKFTGH